MSKFKTYLREEMIRYCQLNPEDYARDNHIYVPSGPLLQRDIKRRKNIVKRVPRVPLPTDIFLYHKNIELYLGF